MSEAVRQRSEAEMPRRLRVLALASGTSAALLGLITSVGWLLDIPVLVRFAPSVAPMVLSAALCFLLTGVALLALGLGRTSASHWCGIVIAALAALTLIAYLSPATRIAQVVAGGGFMDPDDPERPLRMAPNTATAFLLVGLALGLARKRVPSSGAFAGGAAAGLAVLSLSSVALVGYVFRIQPAFGWGRATAMSPQSAVGLAILGFAIVSVVGRLDLTVGHHRKRWLALLVGSAGAITTLLLWQALTANQQAGLQKRLDAEALSIRNAVSLSLRLHVESLARLAERWQRRPAPLREDWLEDAGLYVRDFPGYQDISWVDDQGRMQWRVPPARSGSPLHDDPLSSESRGAAVEAVRRSGRVAVTLARPLLHETSAFLVALPLSSQRGRTGSILAAFGGASFLHSGLSAESRANHRISLLLDGEALASATPGSSLAENLRSQSGWSFLGQQWKVEVVPTTTWANQQLSALPEGALCGGLLFSGLLAWSVLRTGVARLTVLAQAQSERVLRGAHATLEEEHLAAEAEAWAASQAHERFAAKVAERRTAEAERDRFFALSIDMLCISSTDGFFKRLNPAFEQTLGYTLDELMGRPFLDFVHPDDIESTLDEVTRQFAQGAATMRFENRYRCKDGTYRWLAWTSMPDLPSGLMYGLARDVTNEKLVAQRLQVSEERYRGLVEAATDIIYQTNPAGEFTFVNGVAVRIMGYSEEELVGEHFSALVRPDQREEVRKSYESQGSWSTDGAPHEFVALAKDGHELWIEQTVQPVLQDGQIVAFQAIARDVTSRKGLEADRERLISELKSTLAEVRTLGTLLETLSLTDALTDVPNRRAFEQGLDKEIARARRHDHALGLIALDIDHFKVVNDTHGHEGGDEVLRSFARTAVAALRKGDSLYRTGGEEFAVILPGADLVSVSRAAERIVAAVAASPVAVGERLVPITISAGGACLQPGGDERDVWARADEALYEAKRTGRNRVCLAPVGTLDSVGAAPSALRRRTARA